MGTHLQDEIHKPIIGIAFNIELGADKRFQLVYIRVADMSFIGSWVHRNTLCTEGLTVAGSFDDVRIISPARIPECGNFINIDAESGHCGTE